MVKIFTMGFAKKNAKTFFETLLSNNIRKLIDVRLNNVSQLAGFTKKADLEYFLNKICNITYEHALILAPTKEIVDDYKKKKITWDIYEKKYMDILSDRKIESLYRDNDLHMSCFLCSEPTAQRCHRRLLAEYLLHQKKTNIQVIHL